MRIRTLAAIVFTLLSGGCTHIQLARNTVNQADSVADVHTQQVLDNLAKFARNPEALPHFSWPNAGATNVNDTSNGNVGFNFNPNRLTSWLFGFSGSRAMGESYTMTPINDPRKLELMRCAYQRAVASCCQCACESANCPACQVRFNKFYLGKGTVSKTPMVTSSGEPIYAVKRGYSLWYQDTRQNSVTWKQILPAASPETNPHTVYAVRNDRNQILFLLRTDASNSGAPIDVPVFRNFNGDHLETAKGGQLETLYVDNTVSEHTYKNGTVTSSCLNPCCWFRVGSKRHAAQFSRCHATGHYCGTYVWVPESGRDQLTRLTLIILDIALNDAPTGRTKEVVAYLDGNRKPATRDTATYKVTATLPFSTSVQTVLPSASVFASSRDVSAAKLLLRAEIRSLLSAKTPRLANVDLKSQMLTDETRFSALVRALASRPSSEFPTEEFQKIKAAADLVVEAEDAAEQAAQEAILEAERKSIERLPAVRSPVPGAGFLQFEQQRRAALAR